MEQVLHILGGLNSRYNTIVTTIIQKKRVCSLDEVFIALRMHEKQLKRINATDTQLFQANLTIS